MIQRSRTISLTSTNNTSNKQITFNFIWTSVKFHMVPTETELLFLTETTSKFAHNPTELELL
jgi:hypothetical protein